MVGHYRTNLIKDAIRMATGTGPLQPGAVLHTDRGSNYTSEEFGRFLTGVDTSRPGRPHRVQRDQERMAAPFCFHHPSQSKAAGLPLLEGPARAWRCSRRPGPVARWTATRSPSPPISAPARGTFPAPPRCSGRRQGPALLARAEESDAVNA